MIFLLRDSGLINRALIELGLIHAPLRLLYTEGAVLAGLVYGALPFMILPIYASLEKLDPALLEAAEGLGARPWARFSRVRMATHASRRSRRVAPRLRPIPRLVRGARPPRRRAAHDDRQPDPESVRPLPQLAVRVGGCLCGDGAGPDRDARLLRWRARRPGGDRMPAAADGRAAHDGAAHALRGVRSRRCYLCLPAPAAARPRRLLVQSLALRRAVGRLHPRLVHPARFPPRHPAGAAAEPDRRPAVDPARDGHGHAGGAGAVPSPAARAPRCRRHCSTCPS